MMQMPGRIRNTLLAFALVLAGGNQSFGQNPFQGIKKWYGEFRTQFNLDCQRNNAFPQPFATADQMAVQRTLSPMFAKGATINRILDSVHFDPATHKLNNVGRTRLREYLAQQKPLDIFIASTLDPKVDKARQKQLSELLAQYSFPGHRPGVSTTFYLPHHLNATEKATLRDTFLSNQPSPSLQTVAGSISGSTGGQ